MQKCKIFDISFGMRCGHIVIQMFKTVCLQDACIEAKRTHHDFLPDISESKAPATEVENISIARWSTGRCHWPTSIYYTCNLTVWYRTEVHNVATNTI